MSGRQSQKVSVAGEGVEYRFISGGNDNLLKVWKLVCSKRGDGSVVCAAEMVFTLVGHGSAVTDVKFNVDGKMAASTSLDKTVRLWAVSIGEMVTGELKSNPTDDNILQINEFGYQCLTVLNSHKRYVTTCAFSLDGTLLATGDF